MNDHGFDSSAEAAVMGEVFELHSRETDACIHCVEVLCDSYKIEVRKHELR